MAPFVHSGRRGTKSAVMVTGQQPFPAYQPAAITGTSMGRTPLRITAVGDLQLGDSPTCVGFGFASRYAAADFPRVFRDVAAALAGSDVSFGNLETPLTPATGRPGSWSARQLRGDRACARALRAVGFNVLNVANNHSAQHGIQAFDETVTALEEAGIAVCGRRGSGPWACAPVTLHVRGARVGILGYCLRPRQYDQRVPPYAEGDLSAILADVQRLRADSDQVIVSLHWGEEFVPLPSTDERQFARALVNAGVSVVLGHHPHVVRPVERYRQGVIAYSLGNCVGDMVWYGPFRTGAVLGAVVAGPEVVEADVRLTALHRDFVPHVGGVRQPLVDSRDLRTLDADAYQRAIRVSWRRQRLAAYGYTAARVWRFPPRILFELAVRTLRNKFVQLLHRPDVEGAAASGEEPRGPQPESVA